VSADDVYRRLQKHIDQMPVAYPATESGVELRLLQHLFTPEEAEMALHLSAIPEPIEKVHSRAKKAGYTLEELRGGLDRLAEKGAIRRPRSQGIPLYAKAMLAIGMYELQAGRISKDYHADMRQYMDEGFGEALLTGKTSQMRTIPINEEVLPDRTIGTFDGARSLVMESAGPFAVIPCVCRDGMDLEGESCRQTDVRETCLVMGAFAAEVVRTGVGRKLTRDEMVGMLERANEVGMVLQPQNTRDPNFICCCCGCCCAVLSTARKLPRPAEYFDANYYAVVDPELCNECRNCQDRCEMDAVNDSGGPSAVDLLRCIGCGLCVPTCPDGAITLHRKPDAVSPPKNQNSLYLKILYERYGPVQTARLLTRKALGMKV
jgi:Fe-S-cluster-containing hydrogenase component 2